MKNQDLEKQRIIDALRILMHLRWFWCATIIVTGILANVLPGIKGNTNFPAVYMVIMAFIDPVVANIFGYYYIQRPFGRLSIRGLRLLAAGQIVLDYISAIMVVYFAGGIIGIGFLWLVFNIVAAAYIYSFWGVIITAAFATVLYVGLLSLQLFNIIPYYSRYGFSFEPLIAHSIAPVGTNSWVVSSSFFMIAVFSGLIARNLRKKEKEIVEERDKVTSVFGDLIDGLIYINKQDVIEMVNPQAEKLLGIRANKIVGKNVVQLEMGKTPILKQILSVDSEQGKEINPPGKEGQSLLVSSSEVKDSDGNYIGTAKIIRDISREKLVDSMKSEFITIAGHQLRTPLSAIKGAVNLLKSGDYGPVTKDQKDVLEQTYKYNDRLIMLINDLLEVSSLEEGKFEYKFEPTDIHDLLKDVTGQFSNEAKQKDIKYNLNFKNNLSDVLLDPYKIKLAMSSLINNAITYTPKRGRVDIMCEFTSKDTIKISIHDSGIGIPKDEQNKVFTKFFRADNALRVDTEGNGLDLFVTKNIIEQHQGKIWFESSEGVGTCFYIEIPVKHDK